MATAAWKQKRLENTQRLIDKAKTKMAKAEADAQKANEEVARLEGLIAWLETMPVEDDEPDDAGDPQDGESA